MKRKEIVRRAVHFENPPRVPTFWYMGHWDDSDAILIPVRKWYEGANENETELGFKWAKAKNDNMTMGVPDRYLLKDFNNFDNYFNNILLDPYDPNRFSRADSTDFADHYAIADIYVSGFTAMWLLRGFDDLIMDMIADADRFNKFADSYFEYENKIVEQLPAHNFDCAAFFDDWGTQSAMMISPDLWRKCFKERYQEQFKLCHDLGMDVFFHTCGYVYPIIEDLIEVGVDILNLGQMNVNNLYKVAKNFHDKVCFCQPIDYQTTGLFGTKEEIYAEAKELLDYFFDERGGLIAHLVDYELHHYETVSPMNTQYQHDAFVLQSSCKRKIKNK